MNKKISLGVAISLVAIGCAITFVLTWAVSLNIYNSKIGSSEKYEGIYAKLREMDTAVRTHYIGSINDDTLADSVLKGYVSGIGDKYAEYLPANSYYEFQQTTEGVVQGAGIEAAADGSGYLVVSAVYKGSSAEINGVQAGDVITEINGKSLLNYTENEALEQLSGAIGTKLALKILRNGEEIGVNLVRQQLEIESVTGRVINEKIGFISITAFNAKTAEQFSGVLDELIEAGVQALVIDVRNNLGGSVAALKPMLNHFITTAIVATAEYSDGSRKTLVETDSTEVISLPMAVLVDGNTASASELFACALRDNCGAVLVGEQTRGKAVMQSVYELTDGSAVRVTTAKIYTPKSGCYDGEGLKPDYVTELAAGVSFDMLTDDTDTQLQKALEVLASVLPTE